MDPKYLSKSVQLRNAAKVVRNLISPWTASKISVSRGIPDELIQLLGRAEFTRERDIQFG